MGRDPDFAEPRRDNDVERGQVKADFLCRTGLAFEDDNGRMLCSSSRIDYPVTPFLQIASEVLVQREKILLDFFWASGKKKLDRLSQSANTHLIQSPSLKTDSAVPEVEVMDQIVVIILDSGPAYDGR